MPSPPIGRRADRLDRPWTIQRGPIYGLLNEVPLTGPSRDIPYCPYHLSHCNTRKDIPVCRTARPRDLGPKAANGFRHLLSPLKIGRITVRNRAFSSAHGTGFGRNGQLTDRHIEYHRARAGGGIGLIVIEATSIDNSPIGAGVSSANLRNVDDSILPLYRQLADAVHAEGAKIFCLLSHSGRNTVMGAQGQPPVAPSPIPMDRTRDIPHALEREEIAAIVAGFAAAARRCRDGGLDGVELSFTHGNLVQQFLSPASNKRDDEYGGQHGEPAATGSRGDSGGARTLSAGISRSGSATAPRS